MPLFFVLLLSIGLPLLYLSMVGVLTPFFYSVARKNCHGCGGRGSCYNDHGGAAFLLALVFPISIWGWMYYFNRYPSMKRVRENRLAAQRQKEIEDAEHQAELAEIRARENIAIDRMLNPDIEKRIEMQIRKEQEIAKKSWLNRRLG